MSQPDPFVGSVIDDRYRLTRLLGRGAFGTVYAAEHERLKAPFALKFLAANMAAHPGLLKRFEREAQTTCQLRHPNIVDVVDYGEDERLGFYLVMELLDGENLKERLRRSGGLSQSVTRDVALQIADALRVAHARGVVHRDIKPANVMLLRDEHRENQVKLCDFGVAGLTDDSGEGLTATGAWIGTPSYMSPEQWEGKDIDARSDVYALGVLIYEMLTGRVPFQADSAIGLCDKHRTEPPISPRERCPDKDIHPVFEALVLRCLEKEKDRRFQSMNEVLHQLRLVPVGGGTADWDPLGATAPGSDVAAASTVVPPTLRQEGKAATVDSAADRPPADQSTGAETREAITARRGRPVRWIAPVAASVVVAVALVMVLSGPGGDPSEAGPPPATSAAPATDGGDRSAAIPGSPDGASLPSSAVILTARDVTGGEPPADIPDGTDAAALVDTDTDTDADTDTDTDADAERDGDADAGAVREVAPPNGGDLADGPAARSLRPVSARKRAIRPEKKSPPARPKRSIWERPKAPTPPPAPPPAPPKEPDRKSIWER